MAQVEAIRSAVESVDVLSGADARRARKLRLEARAIPVDGPKVKGDDARAARKLRQMAQDAAAKKDGKVAETERLAKIAEAAAKRRDRKARRQANEERALLGLDEPGAPQPSPEGPEISPAPDASRAPEGSASGGDAAENPEDPKPEEPKVVRRIVDESIAYDITAAKVLDHVLAREAAEEAKRRFELDKSILNNLELWNKPPDKKKKKKKKDKKEKKKKKKREQSSESDLGSASQAGSASRAGSDSCARSDSRSLLQTRSRSKSRSRSRSKSRARSKRDDR